MSGYLAGSLKSYLVIDFLCELRAILYLLFVELLNFESLNRIFYRVIDIVVGVFLLLHAVLGFLEGYFCERKSVLQDSPFVDVFCNPIFASVFSVFKRITCYKHGWSN